VSGVLPETKTKPEAESEERYSPRGLLAKVCTTLEARGCQVYVVTSVEEAVAQISAIVQNSSLGLVPDHLLQETGLLRELEKGNVLIERMDREGFAREHGMSLKPLADVRRAIREKIAHLAYGLTAVDAVIANHGALMILDEEGSRHSLSTLPYTHIAVATIEQIVPDLPEAMAVARKLSQTRCTKARLARYISIISGPSSTSDVQGQNVKGMHGPKDVKVILLDLAQPEEKTEK